MSQNAAIFKPSPNLFAAALAAMACVWAVHQSKILLASFVALILLGFIFRPQQRPDIHHFVAPNDHKIHYRPDIDGLRGLSVLLVLSYHAFSDVVSGGFIGVDIFFVISGFLISEILIRSIKADSLSIADFYQRRVRRIFPALLLVTTACLAFGYWTTLRDEFSRLGLHIAGSSGFISNLILYSEAGYFDLEAEKKPLLHLWSLSIEEQFYLIYPAFLYFIMRRKRSGTAWLAIAAAASFGLNLHMVYKDPEAGFYLPATRFWELMAGGLLASMWTRGLFPLNKYRDIVSWFGISLIGAAVVLLDRKVIFPGAWALMPVLGAVAIIAASPKAYLNQQILGNPVAVWFGKISYPLYLWHWPLLVWPAITLNQPLPPSIKFLLACLAVILALGTLHLVENQIRPRGTPATVALVALMTLLGGTGLLIHSGRISPRHNDPRIEPALRAKADWEFPGSIFVRVPDDDLIFYEAKSGASKTLFIGDSNAEQYVPRMAHIISNSTEKSSINSAIIAGNQQTKILDDIMDLKRPASRSTQRLLELASDPSVSTIVVAASWDRYDARIKDEVAFKQLARFLSRASAKKRLFIITNMPSGPELDPNNLVEGSRIGTLRLKRKEAARFDLEAFKRRTEYVHDRVRALAHITHATLIDPLDTLCPAGRCPTTDETGTPLYKDDSHMTATYARSSATYIDQTLRPDGTR